MKGDRGVLNHYDVLSIEDLKALPISNLADDDCILFLWVTMPKLDIVFDVIRAWGFEYKTCAFNWTKMNKKANTPSWEWGDGLGQIMRFVYWQLRENQKELMLV